MSKVNQKNRDTILIVDDNEDIRLLLTEQLQEKGYKTVSAKNGLEAMLKLKNQNFSLIISDINMPKKDGIMLTHEILSLYETPILLMTGEVEKFELRLKLLENVMLLPKPFKPEIISMLVKKIIKESKETTSIAA